MKIGIKYCGGCNSIYDRGKRLKRFQKENPEHEYVSSGTNCDYWMIICGCDRKCVVTDNLYAKRKIVMLADEPGYIAFAKELQEASSEPEDLIRTLHIHDTASLSKLITKDDIETFARITGDNNRLHFDPDTADAAGFDKPIVHGMFLVSLVSTVMGTMLPGAGTVFMSQDMRFMRPAYIGDTVEVTVELCSCEEQEDAYIGVLRGTVRNAAGERLLTGEFRQKMSKKLFKVEQKAQ